MKIEYPFRKHLIRLAIFLTRFSLAELISLTKTITPLMKIFIRVLLPFSILVVGLLCWLWLKSPVESPKPRQQVKQILKTEKIVLHPSDYKIAIESQGILRPQQATSITPLVAGTIQTIHPGFEDGAFFKKGEILLELDPADLQTAVFASRSRLAKSEATLIQEQARAKQARLNWQDIGYKEEPSPLVLREPQLREAEANVSAARADLEQTERNLGRAKVRAPFDGRVKARLVGIGQAVAAATPLGEIFATATAEIRLPLSPSQLPFLLLPEKNDDAPTPVLLHDALAVAGHETTHHWKARIVRTEGTLDPTSRELFAIAVIEDPFSLQSDLPQLRIGQPLRASIEGITLKDVFVVPRSTMREINRIFLIDPQSSQIKKTNIVPLWSNNEVMIVRDEIKSGDWLATSSLPFVPDGAPVEIIPTPPQAEPLAEDLPK
jgi:RND family efflux transporter MFP subunit